MLVFPAGKTKKTPLMACVAQTAQKISLTVSASLLSVICKENSSYTKLLTTGLWIILSKQVKVSVMTEASQAECCQLPSHIIK